MKPVFVDTAALIAMSNRQDAFHSQAMTVRNSLRTSHRNYVTTNAILLEFGNAFSQIRLKPVAIKLIEAFNALPVGNVLLLMANV